MTALRPIKLDLDNCTIIKFHSPVIMPRDTESTSRSTQYPSPSPTSNTIISREKDPAIRVPAGPFYLAREGVLGQGDDLRIDGPRQEHQADRTKGIPLYGLRDGP
ncbi:hypothetical protein MLD38_025244 [Melastoma candidum]|uniref:Uncharacterized protein n=1 Tax=Melastoma candidum TaxID=119954 RepID=A0ACB9NUR4_9MYRT|nr:hypothetical protein MLD38_025244 [Melastoma candidum]